mmetsp:Transcript_4784/g.7467  ORF Transcript_4784/g.7467 Transcript_4784/m.7467 type:complete len:258 (+) Transcript_4784:2-775(+)
MQAGTTGINSMRVYSVTKQGKDQDPTGKFIRRYVPELERVPDVYIHEPWKMPQSIQQQCRVKVGKRESKQVERGWSWYPDPIVQEQESARIAKAKLIDIRKQEATQAMANQVYLKHGSRNHQSNQMNNRVIGVGALPSVAASTLSSEKLRQPTIKEMLVDTTTTGNKKCKDKPTTSAIPVATARKRTFSSMIVPNKKDSSQCSVVPPTKRSKTESSGSSNIAISSKNSSWNCKRCTFLNENKPYGLVCSMCGMERES